jgi:hypothetical protein
MLQNPTPRGDLSAAILTHPAYYAFYGLYADYPLNNLEAAALGDVRRVRETLRELQPLLGQQQPYHKTWALRLFTEREALGRFAPELVDEAWRQLRQVVDGLGPPTGWTADPAPRARRDATPRRRLQYRRVQPRPPAPPQAEPTPRPPSFPKSPVDYRQEA